MQNMETENTVPRTSSEFGFSAQNGKQSMDIVIQGKLDNSACQKSLKEIIDLLDHGHHPSVQVDFQTLASLLRKCGLAKALTEGKRLHAHLMKRGLHRNLLLGNLLLQMYVNCGSLTDVHDCFLTMHHKNRFSWNFLITAYARHGQHEHAIHVFHQMQCEGLLPNEFIFASVISACASKTAMMDGKHTHTQLIGSGIQSNVAVHNALVNMYSRCSCLEDARRLFDQMLDRNVVSWTGMILAYAQHGNGKDALLLYMQMQQEGVIPNKVTFISILDACSIQKWLIEGKWVHVYIIGSGLESEVVLATSLVKMYGKCGSLEDAHSLFERMLERNTVLWTAMIAGYSHQGHADEALELFNRMLLEGALPDNVTYSSIFDACACQTALTTGKQVHATTMSDDLQSNIVVATALVNMYGKCGVIKEARCIFDQMEEHNLLSWTAMISSYVQHGNSKEAIQLFKRMQREGVPPDKVIFWSVVDACATQAALGEGKWVHGLIMGDGLESDSVLATALINMYGKCGKVDDARDMFDKTPERDLVSWTAMITAYAQHGHDKEALLLYDQMQQEGMTPNKVTFISILSAYASDAALVEAKRIHISIANSEFYQDVVVMTALVNMYGKCGSQEDARRTFDEMEERNVISWNTMIAAYSHCGCGNEALELFENMQSKGVAPNKASFVSILDVCANEATLSKGKGMHALASQSGFDLDLDVGNAVINMYGKCGRLEDARKLFDQMLERDIVSWNTIIGAFAQHGHSNMALELFEQMLGRGWPPDKVTYVGVLSACGHAGLVGEGRCHFDSLTEDHGISPTTEHYHCMIHMFARSGLMEEAEDFISKMPFQPTSVTWMALLSACRGHPDMGRGECAVKHMIELDEENASPYVMLSNIYSACKSEKGVCASDLRGIHQMVY